MSWAAAASAAVAVVGSYSSSKAAGDAADAAGGGADAAAQVQWDMFDETNTLLEPYRNTGVQANKLLSSTLGGDYSAFQKSPGYDFAFKEGMKGVENSASARGMTMSGAQLKALNRYGQGVADQEYGNWFGRTYDLARLGQNSAAQTGAAGQSAASNAGNALIAGGNARATGYINQANARNSGLNALAGVAGNYFGGQ